MYSKGASCRSRHALSNAAATTFFEALLRELYRIEILTPERMQLTFKFKRPYTTSNINSMRNSQRYRVSAGQIYRAVSDLSGLPISGHTSGFEA